MSTVLAIQFRPDGSGVCLNTDVLPLQTLGKLTVKRASNVEFNHARQLWEVRLESSPGKVAYSHASRRACIGWEIETLNKKIMKQ